MKECKTMLMAVCAACLLTGTAAERRMEYPDSVRRSPQLKGVMLGASTEKEFRDLHDMGATLVRIFVGEFSAAAYAPGGDEYINDLCDLFREYGWDWTYHAFRESTCWSFEHEGPSFYELKKAANKTRRQEILEKYMKDNRVQGVAADKE